MKKFFILFTLIFCIVEIAFCDEDGVPISYGKCVEDEFSITEGCSIDSVKIEGCRKDRGGTTCNVKRNRNGTMTINYTPDFDSTNNEDVLLLGYALLPGTGTEGRPMPDMDPEACKFMTCPIVKGVQNKYRFGIKIPASYPIGSFNVRFLLKNAGVPKCCFFTKIRVEK